MKNSLFNVLKLLFIFVLYFIDTIVWIILKIISGEKLMKLLNNIFIKNTVISFKKSYIQSIKKKVKDFYSKKNIFSSCLSKSISIKLILDFLNIENKLYLGIGKLSNNKKIAHAWLVDPINGEFITPGLKKNKSLTVYII